MFSDTFGGHVTEAALLSCGFSWPVLWEYVAAEGSAGRVSCPTACS